MPPLASLGRDLATNRYEAGLTDVASLIRSAELLAQAETQQTAARVAVLTESAALERSFCLGQQRRRFET